MSFVPSDRPIALSFPGRVGLLPLRKRPRDYLTWMLDDNSDWGEDREDAGSKGSKGRRSKQVKQGGSGGSCRGGDTAKAAVASKGSSKDSKGSSAKAGGSRLMVHKLGAKDGAAMKAAGEGSGTGKCAKQQQHIQPPRLKVPEGPMITYGRCKSGSVPADGSAVGIAQQQVVAQVGNGNRRLGGLSGPIGSIRSVLQPQPTGARLP